MDTSGTTTPQAGQPLATSHEFAMQFTSTRAVPVSPGVWSRTGSTSGDTRTTPPSTRP
ncbi:hypothetical protein ACR6C2_10425 [Streptomyces sp. INA 01156]